MQKDRFVKAMLVIIALLLVANLLNLRMGSKLASGLESVAHAQSRRPTTLPDPPLPVSSTVKTVHGYSVADLKEVVSLGDGKSFVVSNPKGFMVYQVETKRN